MSTSFPEHTINQEAYVTRMREASNKYDFASQISINDSVLDIGCADGSLLAALKSQFGYIPPHQQLNYTGFDISRDMVARAKANHPQYFFTTSLDTLSDQLFDVIVVSSVLHEVFSYEGYSFTAVSNFLKELSMMLTEHGRIIIRDGIIPETNQILFNGKPALNRDIMSVEIIDPAEIQDALYVLRDVGQCLGISLFGANSDEAYVSGPIEDMVTFLNIMTWGWSSIPREKNECVNFATIDQWEQIISDAGLGIDDQELITQTDYFDHLTRFTYIDEGVSWPTKVIFTVTPISQSDL